MTEANSQSRPVIAYIGGFELPDLNAAASRALAAADVFASCGYDIAIIGSEKNPHREFGDIKPCGLPEGTSKHIQAWDTGYPRNKKEWLTRTMSCSASLRHLEMLYGPRLSGIIFYNYPAIAQIRARRWAKQRGLSVLADITEWYEDDPWRSVHGIVKNIDTRLRMYHVNKGMRGLIVTSPFLKTFYQNRDCELLELPTLLVRDAGFSAHDRAASGKVPRLFFAGSGFDATAFAGAPELLKDRLDWCLDLLFRAHQEGAEFHYDIFGTTQADFVKICPSLTDACGEMVMAGKVVFHGRQPRQAVLKTLWDADYAFFMRKPKRSTNAGFPTKLSEALTHGVPVLTNPMDNVDSYIKTGQTGDLIDPETPDNGYSTLRIALLRSPREREIMRNNCLAEEPFHARNFRTKACEFLGKSLPQKA